MSATGAAGLALLALVGSWAALLFAFRDVLRRLWREPVLRDPVLIVESDDWGPAPALHAQRLARLCDMLARHRDAHGRTAVMTVGVVLAVPDAAAIRAGNGRAYARRTLLDADFAPVREALLRGHEQGVLALQLHGLEHLWPAAFMAAAARDEAVRRWLERGDGTDTEALPSPLQSRWTDGAALPSRPLAEAEVAQAAAEETQLFRQCFGRPAHTAVPPTFVWNAAVERAWAAAGVAFIVTPGRRYGGRDASGRPGPADLHILNGETAAGGATYLVRDIYFEPARGHGVGATLEAVARHVALGRPALLETHRFNFTGDEATFEASLRELDALLAAARQRWPTLRFLGSGELGRALVARDPALVAAACWPRLVCWTRRAAAVGRLRKLSWLNGMALAACALLFAWRVGYRDRRGWA